MDRGMTYRERAEEIADDVVWSCDLYVDVVEAVEKAFYAVENEVLTREFPHYTFAIAPVVEAERKPILGEMSSKRSY
jgi:hypothetical protein